MQLAWVPLGVTMAPSGSMVDPDGTSQIWKTVCGLHPTPDASLSVSAPAGTEQAGMTCEADDIAEPPPEVLEHATTMKAATEYETSALAAFIGLLSCPVLAAVVVSGDDRRSLVRTMAPGGALVDPLRETVNDEVERHSAGLEEGVRDETVHGNPNSASPRVQTSGSR